MDNTNTASLTSTPAQPVVPPQSEPPVSPALNTPPPNSTPLPADESNNGASFPPPYTSPVTQPSRKKYLLIAAAAVVLIVVAGAGSYFLLGSGTKVSNQIPASVVPAPTQAAVITTPTPPAFDLVIDSPTSDMVVNTGKITVSGKTQPNTTVVFYNTADQNSVESDANGEFQGTLTLSPGINSLTVSAFDSQGEEKTVNVNVVYDTPA